VGGSLIVECKKPSNINLTGDDNYLYFTFDGIVFFSATKRLDTMDCHVGAIGRNKRFLRIAINEFCEYIFNRYVWCNKISACVKLKSVKNLCMNCGFEKIADIDGYEVMVKWADS
jgi:hypothetical protein